MAEIVKTKKSRSIINDSLLHVLSLALRVVFKTVGLNLGLTSNKYFIFSIVVILCTNGNSENADPKPLKPET